MLACILPPVISFDSVQHGRIDVFSYQLALTVCGVYSSLRRTTLKLAELIPERTDSSHCPTESSKGPAGKGGMGAAHDMAPKPDEAHSSIFEDDFSDNSQQDQQRNVVRAESEDATPQSESEDATSQLDCKDAITGALNLGSRLSTLCKSSSINKLLSTAWWWARGKGAIAGVQYLGHRFSILCKSSPSIAKYDAIIGQFCDMEKQLAYRQDLIITVYWRGVKQFWDGEGSYSDMQRATTTAGEAVGNVLRLRIATRIQILKYRCIRVGLNHRALAFCLGISCMIACILWMSYCLHKSFTL